MGGVVYLALRDPAFARGILDAVSRATARGDDCVFYADRRSIEQVGAERPPVVPADPLLDLSAGEVAPQAHEFVGAFLETPHGASSARPCATSPA